MSFDEDSDSHAGAGEDSPPRGPAPEAGDAHRSKAAGGADDTGGSQAASGSKDSAAPKNPGDAPEAGTPEPPRSKKPLIILAIVVVVLAIVGFIYWFVHRNQVATDDAYTDGNTVTMVPRVAGYVVGLYVDDNIRVKKGDLLVRLDARDYVTARAQAEAQLTLAKAQLTAAQNALVIAKVQYPAQLVAARAQRQAAVAAAAQAEAAYRRQNAVDRRATTQENIDAANSQQISSAANVEGAAAQVTIAALVPEQIEQAAVTVAERRAQVEQAEAQLAQADLNLGYTEVRSPVDGFITLRSAQLGGYLTAGQTMFLIVTPEVWVTANFKESQIGRMRPGDRVDLGVDAYSSLNLHGHVQSIQYGSGSKFSAFPAENATGNYVKIVQRIPVKIVIDDGLDPNRPLPLGLSVSPVVYFP
jgi:membrane fusion protein (multidrug efflux system)